MGNRGRGGITTADRYGDIGAAADWQAVMAHYDWDRVEAAYKLALDLGAGYGGSVLGLYRMVEGEAVTRERSRMERPRPWLQIETIDAELQGVEALQQRIGAACDEVAERLGWTHERETLVSVLSVDVDAPWHGARFGYFVVKHPYDKICIPNATCYDPAQTHETVAHEYTHLIVSNKCLNRAPDWLQEGLAMLMQGEPVEQIAPTFRQGAPWLDPDELDQAFHGERRDPRLYGRVWHAYQQSAAIGLYLHSLKGDAGVVALLEAFGNNTFWQEVKINLLGEPGVEEALQEVFGISEVELFEQAAAWIKG